MGGVGGWGRCFVVGREGGKKKLEVSGKMEENKKDPDLSFSFFFLLFSSFTQGN